ncbi:MAG TPA: sigma-70 family RNA polymerase sigma factor [Gemmatimonadaceae bacterium]|nr:sigma-70 family RNA polymerase sigma factor [Gemmatimonadaceae bacterium]
MNDSAVALQLHDDVIAAAAGDHDAFGRLVDATRTVVTSITLAILRDSDASADAAQDVFIAAWTGLSKLKDPTSFLPWIRQLARNRAHHTLRSRIRFGRRITNHDVDEILAAATDPRPSAIEAIIAGEQRAALASAIDALPPSTREIVILYYREGQSARQVASLLGMSEDAVKQRLSRSRAHLRESLIRQLTDTVPTAAFTIGVLTAISFVAPSSAAAATLHASKTAAGKTLTAKMFGIGVSFGAIAGAAAGLIAGGAAVVLRANRLFRLARDDDERRGIAWWSIVTMLTMIGFMTVVISVPRPVPVTIAYLVMAVVFVWCHLVWLPRITRRRYAAELRENPTEAAAAHGARRRQSVLGCLVGLTIGGMTVAAMWIP